MHINQLQQAVRDDWAQRSHLSPTSEQKLLFVIEELGEVAEAIRRQSQHPGDHKADNGQLASEFADLLIAVTTLANEYDVDLEAAIGGFWEKLASRRAA